MCSKNIFDSEGWCLRLCMKSLVEMGPGEGKDGKPLTDVKSPPDGAELEQYCLTSVSACLCSGFIFDEFPQESHENIRMISTHFIKSYRRRGTRRVPNIH